jgi:hypothetical protein
MAAGFGRPGFFKGKRTAASYGRYAYRLERAFRKMGHSAALRGLIS